jgi:hypothetical protein
MIKREETADNINKRMVTPPLIEVNFGLMRSQLVDLRWDKTEHQHLTASTFA